MQPTGDGARQVLKVTVHGLLQKRCTKGPVDLEEKREK